ncbi:PREDICTED: WAS/WASL-interacting protein family member 1-like [Lepidothrix coronata]|uniref:WAS/WASL-interacting protein family member 1-like n=1 Tax=Lepidothrix coronata TaxID=321398 RepID=A0A6J0HIE3_9PASS|nr:PREDICTED: WAS/WASL-interacting protein family member 1-like [Lepidothrix coronata]
MAGRGQTDGRADGLPLWSRAEPHMEPPSQWAPGRSQAPLPLSLPLPDTALSPPATPLDRPARERSNIRHPVLCPLELSVRAAFLEEPGGGDVSAAGAARAGRPCRRVRRDPGAAGSGAGGPVSRGGPGRGPGGGGLAAGSPWERLLQHPGSGEEGGGRCGHGLSIPTGDEEKPALLPPPEREKFTPLQPRSLRPEPGLGVGIASFRPLPVRSRPCPGFLGGTPLCLRNERSPQEAPTLGKEELLPFPAVKSVGCPLEWELVSVRQGTACWGGGGSHSRACPGPRLSTYPEDISLLSATVRTLPGNICIAGRQKLVGKVIGTCSSSTDVADGHAETTSKPGLLLLLKLYGNKEGGILVYD